MGQCSFRQDLGIWKAIQPKGRQTLQISSILPYACNDLAFFWAPDGNVAIEGFLSLKHPKNVKLGTSGFAATCKTQLNYYQFMIVLVLNHEWFAWGLMNQSRALPISYILFVHCHTPSKMCCQMSVKKSCQNLTDLIVSYCLGMKKIRTGTEKMQKTFRLAFTLVTLSIYKIKYII